MLRLDTGVVLWAGPSLDLTDEVVKILAGAMWGPLNGAARHRVTLLLQHGSTVSGRVHAHSDLDIAALFEASDVSLADVAGLGADLQGLNPGREVDVAVLNHADPLFLKLIIENCRLLHGSPRRLAELGMYAYKRYQGHRRFLALEQS